MSMEKARAHLASFGLEGRIQEFTVSSATVGLAAEAVGCEPARIAKTLSFENGDGSILVVAAGDAKVDNRKSRRASATAWAACAPSACGTASRSIPTRRCSALIPCTPRRAQRPPRCACRARSCTRPRAAVAGSTCARGGGEPPRPLCIFVKKRLKCAGRLMQYANSTKMPEYFL